MQAVYNADAQYAEDGTQALENNTHDAKHHYPASLVACTELMKNGVEKNTGIWRNRKGPRGRIFKFLLRKNLTLKRERKLGKSVLLGQLPVSMVNILLLVNETSNLLIR
jgi:hypothetical protein